LESRLVKRILALGVWVLRILYTYPSNGKTSRNAK
jgi:hypothetical protein